MTWGDKTPIIVQKKPRSRDKRCEEALAVFDAYDYNPLAELIEKALEMKSKGFADIEEEKLFFNLNKEMCAYFVPKMSATKLDINATVTRHEDVIKLIQKDLVLEHEDNEDVDE